MRQLVNFSLKPAVCEGLEAGHPWVFRDKMGPAAQALPDGAWLRLLDSEQMMIGTGIYQAEGGVAIRVLRLGHRPVTVDWLKQQLEKAISARQSLALETDAYRVLNGESDGFPGIVIDVYSGVGVLQTYAPGLDALGRYLAGLVFDRLGLKSLIWKAPSKRVGGKEFSNRLLRGPRPYVVKFTEGELPLAADLFAGQKSGTYLDLRGLRRYLAGLDLKGKKVLNLFSYTGMAGLACARAGASEVVNVDQAQASLDFGERYHKAPAQRWRCADIFEMIETLPNNLYDLIIVDPPSMASNKTQVAKALKTYHRIYSNLRSKLKADGTLIACCCTSRISPREFEDKVSYALRPMSRKFALPMERDHQPAFAEADYLKVLVFRQDPGAKPQKVPVYRREPRPAAAKKSDGSAGKGRGSDRERAKGRPSPSKAKAKAKKPRRR